MPPHFLAGSDNGRARLESLDHGGAAGEGSPYANRAGHRKSVIGGRLADGFRAGPQATRSHERGAGCDEALAVLAPPAAHRHPVGAPRPPDCGAARASAGAVGLGVVKSRRAARVGA